jgi:hypothetical protein
VAEKASIVIAATDATGAAFSSVSGKLAGLQNTAASTVGRLSGLAASLGGLFAAGGIGALVQNTINGIDALNDLADATGSSIRNLSALEDTALRTGTSLDTAGGALVKFNQALNAAKPDSEIARIITSIGLSVEGLKSQDPSEALAAVARALSQYEDDANKARVVQDLFGRSVREVAPLLKDLADRGLGVASVTAQQTREAEAFNLELAALSKNATDASRAFVSDLLPSLTATLQAIRQFGEVSNIGSVLGSGLQTTIQALTVFGANVAFVFQGVGREVGAIAAQIVALGSLDIKGFRAISDAVKADAARARAELDALTQRILNPQRVTIVGEDFSDRGRGRTAAAPLPSVRIAQQASAARSAAAIEDKAARYLDTLRKQLESTQDLTTAERALIEIRSGALGKVSGPQEKNILALAREIDATKAAEVAAKARVDFRRAEAQAIADYDREVQESRQRTLDVLLGNTDTGRVNQLRAQIELLNEEFQNADPSRYVQIGEAIRAVQADLDGIQNKGVETFDVIGTFAERAAENIQDALGNTLEQIMSGSFDNIGRLWLNLMQKMLAQAAATQLNEALFGSKGKGSIIDLIGTFLGGGNIKVSPPAYTSGGITGGSILPNSLRGGAATGANMLDRDMITLVHRGEAIVPKAYNPALGGSRVTVNNYAGADVQTRDRADGGLDIDILTRVVEQRMAGNVAGGRGPLSGALKSRGLNSTTALARIG